MNPTGARVPELALPATALGALRRTLLAELGPDRAATVLRNAGHAAGDALFQILTQPSAEGQPRLAELDADRFWRRFAHLFAARGWGNLAHQAVHPGVAVLDSSDWAEADTASGARRPSCFFTTGMLANVLGQVASGEVAVLEVECRSRGDAQCRFLFGSRDALGGVYEQLVSGASADNAVAQLG
ncbi:MAG TPA: V4R domain-containing protein [Longimicrobiales bacterium]|nr:V4R domain-containing protein [Longimicrobiales bacterium]